MGLEATCKATVNGTAFHGKVRLETDTLELRALELKLIIPLKEITKATVRQGVLTIKFAGRTAALELGRAAEQWAETLVHPPSRMQKLGVKPGWRASVIGAIDQDFLQALEESVDHLSIGRVTKPSDAIFYAVTKEGELGRLAKLKASLMPDGAIWIVRPKGRPDISERAVMAAGRAAGLVDVKVVSFSPTHTAEKFVVPRRDRR
jgi:hypothetical protein